MKRLIVFAVIALLFLLPVATAEDSGTQEPNTGDHLLFTQYPQVYINATNQSSFNVSFIALVLFTNSGVYLSEFPTEKWTVDMISNKSVDYRATVHFAKLDSSHIAILEQRFNISNVNPAAGMSMSSLTQNVSEFGDSSITGNAEIYLTEGHLHSPIINYTAAPNVTGFEITFSFSSSQITGPGDLLLIQVLGAKVDNQAEAYHSLVADSSGKFVHDQAGLDMNTSKFQALYWWNETYLLNGNNTVLNYSESSFGQYDVVVFKYTFNSGLNSLVQDPYFSVPQIDLFNNPILQKDIQNTTQFFIEHIEIFSAGLASGIVLLGIPYGLYRKKRF